MVLSVLMTPHEVDDICSFQVLFDNVSKSWHNKELLTVHIYVGLSKTSKSSSQ